MLKAKQYASIMKAISEGTIDSVIQAAGEIFREPVALSDSSFGMISYSGSLSGHDDMIWNLSTGNENVPEEVISVFRENDVIHQVVSNPHKTVLLNWGWFKDHPRITTGVFRKNQLLGYLAVLFTKTSFSPWMDEALQVTADACAAVWDQDQKFTAPVIQEKEVFARDLFLGVIREDQLDTMDHTGLLPRSEEYFVLAAQDAKSISSKNTNPFISQYLYYAKDGIIYILLPSAKNYSPMLQYLSEHGFQIGLSAPFSSVHRCPSAMVQASAAFSYGQKTSPGKSSYSFEDYAIGIIVENCSHMQDFIHPAVWKLMSADRNNGSELLKTLRTYLEETLDISHTASRLKIHRNSLYYRLEKIEEEGHMSLKNPKTLEHLALSFSALDISSFVIPDDQYSSQSDTHSHS